MNRPQGRANPVAVHAGEHDVEDDQVVLLLAGQVEPADVILGACNPSLAHRALEADRSIGLLLPCNVVVRAEGDRTALQALDPQTMVAMSGLGALRPVADEATRRLDAALASLTEV